MAVHFINEAFKHCKPIGATGEGVDLLSVSNIRGIDYADESSEGEVLSEHGVVTAWGADALDDFEEEFVEAIRQVRFWERERMPQVPA